MVFRRLLIIIFFISLYQLKAEVLKKELLPLSLSTIDDTIKKVDSLNLLSKTHKNQNKDFSLCPALYVSVQKHPDVKNLGYRLTNSPSDI